MNVAQALANLDVLDAQIAALSVQAKTIRYLLTSGGEPPAPVDANERPERCRAVPVAQCGLKTDDEDARTDRSTFGGDAWQCNGCGFRSDRDE